ncbi:hypothetical protein BS47DRAFT_1358546 [Hydnum rufescens UP504]|uniref:SPX domain-containing protein n=1 Tax=Hydnum rufescens UP504 TaxID=1448309 RepID=A0A9P6B7F1_9AGAM|nr:hypothetical protein BS47DRAFT_1358546 [Hydnum rufescens UP504]
MKFARYLEDTQPWMSSTSALDPGVEAGLHKCISQIVLATSLESEWHSSSVPSISAAIESEGLSVPYKGAPYSPTGGRIGTTEPPSPDAPPQYGSQRNSQPTLKIQQPPVALYAGARTLHDIPPPTNLEAGTGPGEMLNEELRKVDKFYVERECDALALSSLLKKQLRELQRRLVDDSEPVISHRWLSSLELLNPVKQLSSAARDKLNKSPSDGNFRGGYALNSEGESTNALNPEEYHQNKKKLKKALLEHYRGMELLNNYRILNLTGFRKALKKFEKVTKIPAQNPYMTEKARCVQVEACSFSSDIRLQQMMKEVEDVYAQVFGGGDRKAARSRLRTLKQPRTHHWKTFRSGAFIGCDFPRDAPESAPLTWIHAGLQPKARAAIPASSILLQLYGSFFVLILFLLLITFNIVAWSRARINYVFIFGLDLRTTIDPREYVEIPSLLFLTLSYAFWLSFAGLGTVSPTTWPLGYISVHRAGGSSAKLEDYWPLEPVESRQVKRSSHRTLYLMNNVVHSLSFTLSMLWVAGCAYRNDWQADTVQKCSLSDQWGLPCALSGLPSALRLIQCVRRYKDGGQYMNLINAGKYLSRILYYVFYFLWRQQGGQLQGYSFALFWVFAIIMSVYLAGWIIPGHVGGLVRA